MYSSIQPKIELLFYIIFFIIMGKIKSEMNKKYSTSLMIKKRLDN